MSIVRPSWRPRSFRGQLAASFALLGATLAVVLSASLGALLSAQARRDEGLALRAMADVAARQMADWLELRAREVSVLAESPTLWAEGLQSERVRQVFFRSQALNPYSAWIGVTNADGVVATASGRLLEGVDVSARPWFAAGRDGLFVGDVHPAKLLANMLPRGSDGGPQRFVDFAAPIRHEGRLVGVLGVHGSWDWAHATMTSLLPDWAADRGIEFFVFDRTGQLIYGPSASLAALAEAGQTPPPLVDRAGQRAAPAVVAWRDGGEHLTAGAPVRTASTVTDLGWTVVVREPVAQAFAVARHAVLLALSLGLVATLAAAAVGAWLASRLTQPLRRLAQAALGTDAGNAADAIPLLRDTRELEQLSGALAGMTQRLQSANAGLEAANAELEQRVHDRTLALQRANAELEQRANHDPLTGLLNRRGFDEHAAAALAGARRRRMPLSLLVFDADHFKRINDTHGHAAGDEVLRMLSRLLKARLREVDIVARIGGEEFVALLPDTGSLGACQLAGAVVDRIAAQQLPLIGRVTISCGVAELDPGNPNIDEALARADAALYAAKQGGRNQYRAAPPANGAPAAADTAPPVRAAA